jgi:hypothetical protein
VGSNPTPAVFTVPADLDRQPSWQEASPKAQEEIAVSEATNPDAAALKTPWTPRVLQLLQEWSSRASASSHPHYGLAAQLARFNIVLGVPVVILTTFVGTSVFASIGSSVDTRVRIIVGSISVVAAIIASLQTFLRFAERGEKHRTAAEHWASIRREIDEMLALHPNYLATHGDPKEYLDNLRRRMDRIAAQSPEMGDRAWSRAQATFGVTRSADAGGAAPSAGVEASTGPAEG